MVGKPRPIFVAGILIAALSVVQVLWHWCLNLEVAASAQQTYTYRGGSDEYPKASIAVLLDGVAPAILAGILFGAFGRPTRRLSAVLFSMAVGTMLAALQVVYVEVARYDLWWLRTMPSWKSFIMILIPGMGVCFVPSFGYVLQRTGQLPIGKR